MLFVKLLQHLLVLHKAELGHRTFPRLCLTTCSTPVRFCTQKLYALGTYFPECLRAARREAKVNPEALIWFITICPMKDESRWQSQRLWWVLQMEWAWFPRYLWAYYWKCLIWSSYPCPSILSLFMRQFARKRQSKEDNFYLLLIMLGLLLLHCTGV